MRRTLLAIALLAAALRADAAVTGRVIAADGTPIAGARIRAYPRETTQVTVARLRSGAAERAPLATVESKNDGSFSIDTKGNGVLELFIDAAGRAPVFVEVAEGDDAGTQVLAVAAPRRGRITAGGKGVANAVVRLGVHVYRTNEEGFYDAPDPTGWMDSIRVFHPDHAMLHQPIRNGSLDAELTSGVELSGRVVAADGTTPVANATLFHEIYTLGRTGEDGTFRIAHAPADIRTLIAREGTRAGSIALEPKSAAYTIRLRPAATISGTIRSSKDDTPVAGALVLVVSLTSGIGASAVSDAKGNYTMDGLLPIEGSMGVRHPAFGGDATTPVAAGEGARVVRNISAQPLARVRGSVVDEEKKPVAGARVSVDTGGTSVVTAPDGTFSLRIQRLLRPATLQAAKSGFAGAEQGPFTLQPGESKTVQLVLQRGFRFEVRLIDQAGQPIANEPLWLWRYADAADSQTRAALPCTEADPSRCNVTDAGGLLAINLTEGKYDLRAGGKTTVSKQLAAQQITARTEPMTIELQRGAVVTGRVVMADGEPAPLAQISVGGGSRQAASVSASDAAGAFSILNLPPGPVTLTATSRGGMQGEPVDVTAPAGDVLLRLPRPARIEGRVFDRESKQPVRDFMVNVDRAGERFGARPKTVQADDGRFVLDELAPGKVDVVVSAAGYTRGLSSGVTIEEGKTLTVEIPLDKGGVIAGRVTSGGRPLADVAVTVNSTTPTRAARSVEARTDAGGQYTVEGVTPGAQQLELRKSGYVTKQLTVEVTGAKETRADAELMRGREVRGRVVDSMGRPVSRANVMLRGQMPSGQPIVPTDEDGGFRIEGLADANYTLDVRKQGYLSATLDFNPAATQNVTVTLERGGVLSGRVSGMTEGAEVEVSATGGTTRTQVRPDPQGNFTLEGVPDGDVEVRAMQFRPVRRVAPAKRVTVSGGTGPFVQLDLSEGIVVRGRVTRGGQPAAGMIAFFPLQMQRGRDSSLWGEIAPGGAYEVRLVETGEYQIRVQPFGQGSQIDAGAVAVTGPMTHDVDLRGATLRGRVIDAATGASIAGASVELSGNRSPGRMVSDSDGRFAFELLADGTYSLLARRERYAADPQQVVVNGGYVPDVEVRLQQGQEATLRVIDAADGRPLEASVHLRDEKNVPLYGGVPPRNDRGAMTLWLAPGRYRVFASYSGYVPGHGDLVVPGPEIQIALTRAGRIVVRGTVPGALTMRLRTPQNQSLLVLPLARGGFDSIQAGTYVVELLDSEQKVVASREVMVTSGQTATVVFE